MFSPMLVVPPILSSFRKGLIVSCQAPADSPIHQPMVIAAIAEAAVNRGAVGIRVDTPSHVQAVRQRVKVPIIGLWKQTIPGYEVYITPQLVHAQAIAAAGADIIALDATLRKRPNGETLHGIIEHIHGHLGKLVMADVDSIESATAAEAAGADMVGTTLYGYTHGTQHQIPPGYDLLKQMINQLTVPCICEGGIASPSMARAAIDAGAFAVVVGTAITGIDIQVGQYCSEMHSD
jgi:N-acylglucosamine-6-phosphate 2-epimerase